MREHKTNIVGGRLLDYPVYIPKMKVVRIVYITRSSSLYLGTKIHEEI